LNLINNKLISFIFYNHGINEYIEIKCLIVDFIIKIIKKQTEITNVEYIINVLEYNLNNKLIEY